MKRTLITLAVCLAFLLPVALAQGTGSKSVDDMLNASEQELQQKLQLRDDLTQKAKALEQKKDDIMFAYNAYKKQEGVIQQEFDDFKQKRDALNAQYAPLDAQANQYKAAVAAHNAHVCTEKCDQNGHCDGSCAWYTAEKQRLDAQKANLESAYAPLDAQNAQLNSEGQQLKTNADLLDQLRQNVSNDTLKWTSDVKQWQSAWADNQQQIALLQKNIAQLKAIKKRVDSCMQAIPPECDNPNALGPDGKPLLNGKCERMKAQCGAMFDGNLPQ